MLWFKQEGIAMAQVLVYHMVRGEIVGPPKMVNPKLLHLKQATSPVLVVADKSANKPDASGQNTKSIAESLRAPASGSFQGVTRHAGFRSYRGSKIRCY